MHARTLEHTVVYKLANTQLLILTLISKRLLLVCVPHSLKRPPLDSDTPEVMKLDRKLESSVGNFIVSDDQTP
jgi:hypothetical protein